MTNDRPPLTVPRLARSVAAGLAGTAVLSLAYAGLRRVGGSTGPLDYDDSDVPGQIVANLLHFGSVSEREDMELGYALRWGYGSVFGVWHGIVRTRMTEPTATLAFGATLMSATLTMFPLLGHTPPPWRWPAGYLARSVLTHVAYAATVGIVDDRLAQVG